MTSNLGSDVIRDRMEKWKNKMPEKEEEILHKDIFMLLKKSLRPEFLNRVDEIVMFRPLNMEQIIEIVKIQMNGVRELLKNHNIELEVTEEAIDWLADKGYDPQSGARPVKRLIQKEIINELSKEIIAGKISKDSVIKISIEKGRIVFK
jgi:ATP-dependent Clp protease ATP-binding subunit ClpB